MNVLDENIVSAERERLQSWKVHFRRIGGELGRTGRKTAMRSFPLLHTLRKPTFFTRDQDFYQSDLRHAGYCLVYLDVAYDEAAVYIRRFLRNAFFHTQALRMGYVVRAHPSGLSYWRAGSEREHKVRW